MHESQKISVISIVCETLLTLFLLGNVNVRLIPRHVRSLLCLSFLGSRVVSDAASDTEVSDNMFTTDEHACFSFVADGKNFGFVKGLLCNWSPSASLCFVSRFVASSWSSGTSSSDPSFNMEVVARSLVSQSVSQWNSEWVSERVNAWVGEWVSERVSGGVSEWVSGWVSEWVSEYVCVSQWVSEPATPFAWMVNESNSLP